LAQAKISKVKVRVFWNCGVIDARMIKGRKFRDWIEKILAVLINCILDTFGR